MGLRNAIAKSKSLKTSLSEVDRAIKLANKSFEISLGRFRVGKTTPLELNDVERGLTQLKEVRLQNLLELNRTYTTIDKLTGASTL